MKLGEPCTIFIYDFLVPILPVTGTCTVAMQIQKCKRADFHYLIGI